MNAEYAERIPPYATEPMATHHVRSTFTCGVEPLDRYLKQQASQDAKRHVAQIFVRCDEIEHVIGFYTLSMTSIELQSVPDEMSKRLPRYSSVPAALLGRLAIHSDRQGTGLGTTLLYDAMRRVYEASRGVAAFGLVVDAKDDDATRFYTRHGFTSLTELADDESRLILPVATIARLFPWV